MKFKKFNYLFVAIKGIFGVFIMCVIFTLYGCSKDIETINDFSKFSDMSRETEKIEVTFDNNSGTPFYFTIEDETQIEDIMDIIFSATFENVGTEMRDGGNTILCIVQGENKYNLNIRINKEGNNYYVFSTDELQTLISELAQEAGA